jgi:hypothetical protein
MKIRKAEVREAVRKVLTWRVFARREPATSSLKAILWWELRRIPYNIAVGAAGILTIAVVIAVAEIAFRKFGESIGLPDSPLVAVIGIFVYGIAANICYTGGWVVELLVRQFSRETADTFAAVSFLAGLIFSIFLTLAPAIFFTSLLIVRLLLQRWD